VTDVVEIPGFRDNLARMVSLLEEIERNTSDLDQNADVTLEGATIQNRVGIIPHHAVVINESADLDDDATNAQGAVEMSPGDKRVLAEYDAGTHAVYAAGAEDHSGVQYWLDVDNNPVVGPTFGSLGTVNSPFSFVEKYGGAIPAENRSRLMAQYPSNQTGDITLVGRIHVENVTQ
jgi:hypothetical protein